MEILQFKPEVDQLVLLRVSDMPSGTGMQRWRNLNVLWAYSMSEGDEEVIIQNSSECRVVVETVTCTRDNMQINVCVLGVGVAGLTFHIPFVLALPHLFHLHSVLERNPAPPAGKVHARFGIQVKVNRSLDEVLRNPEIDLVIVATPSYTHYDIAKAALQAGKHGIANFIVPHVTPHYPSSR